MIRHEIEVGDAVRLDTGQTGKIKKLHAANKRAVADVSLFDGGAVIAHPIDGIARIHPPHMLDWTDAELAALWAETKGWRNSTKAVTFARKVLAGRPA